MSYNNCDKRVGNSFCNQPKGHDGQCALVNIPFNNFMDEYSEKQATAYKQSQEVVNLDDMGIGFAVTPTKAVNHEGGTGAGCEPKAAQQHVNGGAAQSFSAPLVTAGPNMEALILAQTRMLLSRSLAYVGLADLKCARQLAVEIRDHLEAVDAYAMAKGIAWDVAEAMINLMGTAKA